MYFFLVFRDAQIGSVREGAAGEIRKGRKAGKVRRVGEVMGEGRDRKVGEKGIEREKKKVEEYEKRKRRKRRGTRK